jgi:hypothetical protein
MASVWASPPSPPDSPSRRAEASWRQATQYVVAVIVLAALATVNLIRLRTHNHAR